MFFKKYSILIISNLFATDDKNYIPILKENANYNSQAVFDFNTPIAKREINADNITPNAQPVIAEHYDSSTIHVSNKTELVSFDVPLLYRHNETESSPKYNDIDTVLFRSIFSSDSCLSPVERINKVFFTNSYDTLKSSLENKMNSDISVSPNYFPISRLMEQVDSVALTTLSIYLNLTIASSKEGYLAESDKQNLFKANEFCILSETDDDSVDSCDIFSVSTSEECNDELIDFTSSTSSNYLKTTFENNESSELFLSSEFDVFVAKINNNIKHILL